MKLNRMNQICAFSCGEWSNRATTVRVRESSTDRNRTVTSLLFTSFIHVCFSDCGINCHRHCRDQVGSECSKKQKNTSGSCPCTPASESRTKGSGFNTSVHRGQFLIHWLRNNPELWFLPPRFQAQRTRPSFSPKVTRQKTTREPPRCGKVTRLTRHCQIAPPRQTLECGHQKKRTREETTTTVLPMRPLRGRWDLARSNQI